jgi:uncharacterized membrane protein (UPF0127 family)
VRLIALPLALALTAACRGPEPAPAPAPQADVLRVDERGLPVTAAPPAATAASSPDVSIEFKKGPLKLPSGAVIQVEFAQTAAQRERGLMFRESLPPDYGMLFVFPERRFLTFWMKNTFVDLDMVFIDESRRISSIQARVPKSRRGSSDSEVARRSGVGRYLLELPAGAAAGYGLKVGQRLHFGAP